MTENVEEISNPIFDYAEADDNISASIQSNFYDVRLLNFLLREICLESFYYIPDASSESCL